MTKVFLMTVTHGLKNEDGEIGHIEEFLFEQAKKAGLEII